MKIRRLELFGDLEEVQFNWSFTLEEGDENSDLGSLVVDRIDGTNEIGEWTIGDFNDFANGEGGLEFWFVFFSGLENLINFFLGNRSRFVVDTNEIGDTLGSFDGNPRIVVESHLDKNITWIGFFLGFDFGAAADDHFRLDGDDGLEDFVF